MVTDLHQPGWQAIGAAVRHWRPLLLYELVLGTLSTTVLGPLGVVLAYRLIELTGEPVLGHSELLRFLLSPWGLVALVLGLSFKLGLLLIEYAGLITLLDAAVRGLRPNLWQALIAIVRAGPRLIAIALVQAAGALLVALPVLAMAAAVYWLLLSEADINYYLAERPPRFWLAAILGGVLGLGLMAALAWFFLRFALAVPACVLEGESARAALRTSLRLMRGRALRLLGMIVAWQLLEYAALLAAASSLDRLHQTLLAIPGARLALLVWSTVAVLAFDTIVLQAVGAVFAIGRALLVTVEYEHAQGARPRSAVPRDSEPGNVPVAPASSWQIRVVLVVLLCTPLISLTWAAAVARQFVEYRPVKVTAHRAGSHAAAENSIEALRLSMAAGADYVEIDVQLTADGQVILMHDRDLRRTTGDPRNVADVRLADLADLRLRGSSEAEPVPTLAAFLDACDDRIGLNIELKETERAPGLALAVVDIVRDQGFVGRAGASCFRLAPLEAIRQAEPRMPVGKIMASAAGDMTRLPVNFLSLNARLVHTGLVRRAHARGLEVHAWAVSDRATALRLMDNGVDNLITSDPVAMRKIVDWYADLGTTERLLMRLRRRLRE